MATFVTRVELHSAGDSDYEKLHTQMDTRGFKRTIEGSNGTKFKLPTATYSYTGNNTIAAVRDLAREAANATGKSNWVITTEGPSTWYLNEE
ncbi:type V toxin-antitoxin system endoribonuclease antitoxin GhoS [Burkholderia gladioli]|uniref:type V toxin-antitoxin system endoribonuclease antitoxin GhoS n=1 Tax=Burkholderia gladioli TaxID=28095 RepID=UPI001640454F|nr:type V toxin-antitoxin system endoribonuclease antitoxin GhoS [Burkholderia gladioli]